MNRKDLIILLIEQDLKHHQLIRGLNQLGLDDGGFYNLEIMTVVQHLIGIKSEELTETFTDLYCSFMNEVDAVDSSDLEDKVPAIANQCYELLVSLVEIESRVKEEM